MKVVSHTCPTGRRADFRFLQDEDTRAHLQVCLENYYMCARQSNRLQCAQATAAVVSGRSPGLRGHTRHVGIMITRSHCPCPFQVAEPPPPHVLLCLHLIFRDLSRGQESHIPRKSEKNYLSPRGEVFFFNLHILIFSHCFCQQIPAFPRIEVRGLWARNGSPAHRSFLACSGGSSPPVRSRVSSSGKSAGWLAGSEAHPGDRRSPQGRERGEQEPE